VGGYASAWWYVLTEMLGYDDVRIYDGSSQEWSRNYDMIIYE
jgi:thiosulfate/3-mercaptopyruvate sulfurtransferase